ncbi:hypothetical protein FC66_GL000715 [Dellaglioa algida DSM 15638]|uniref:Uncharacterized protein n=1 Tax=Dellaglioa algida DSM 15638 TaxID=1423719 RepID=A0A0R1HI31_9LACO|nr:hypothetical protein FC66_GL000715 [Dellaglioa algida DSM 15638]
MAFSPDTFFIDSFLLDSLFVDSFLLEFSFSFNILDDFASEDDESLAVLSLFPHAANDNKTIVVPKTTNTFFILNLPLNFLSVSIKQQKTKLYNTYMDTILLYFLTRTVFLADYLFLTNLEYTC